MKILYKYSEKCVNSFPQAPSFFCQSMFSQYKIKHKKFGAAQLIFVETGREKPGGE